jgi:membrane protein required for colicin V production
MQALHDFVLGLSWVDGSLLAVLAVSIGVGLVRGVVFECLALAGWVVAWFAAQWAAPVVAPHLPVGVPGAGLNLGAAFALAFLAAVVCWTLLARLIRMLIHATPLSLPDRLLGAGFGAMRGGVLLLALASVVTLTPAAQSAPWRSSHGARWLAQGLQLLEPLLPSTVSGLLRA